MFKNIIVHPFIMGQWVKKNTYCLALQERDEWVAAIEQQILASLQGNESSKKQSTTDPAGILAIRNTRGNNLCADCGAASKLLKT